MQLIVLAGLPGTGKSTIADALGKRLGIPVFAKDWLEATLRRCELHAPDQEQSLGYAGYELLTMLAERQLALGQSAILDSVASVEPIRQQWRALAKKYRAAWCVIECVWSDKAAHRAQLVNRQRHIPGWHELEWDEVERVETYYAPWKETRLILDAANSLEQNIAAALESVRHRRNLTHDV